jgi:cytochrome d ubiquinol oxidase subunit I
MESTALTLSRTQFAITAIFHINWPLITIGLSWLMVLMEAMWLKTGDVNYYRHVRFWSKIFVVAFGIGVASGIPLEFQFGTNWSNFASFGGAVMGNQLAFEAAISFALEAAFLAVFMFGWGRVGKRMHFFANIMVALGATLSAFWILSANSWMQTPDGYSITGGVVTITNYQAAVLNPDTLIAFSHMWFASIETTIFFVAAICAWNIRKAINTDFFLKLFKVMLVAGIIVTPLQVFLGDASAQTVTKYEPAKLAAMEAHWTENPPGTSASWALIAWPDSETQSNTWEIRIPYVLSILTDRSLKGQVPGLTQFPVEDQPPVAIPFYAFRIMVLLGLTMVFLVFWALWKWRKKELQVQTAPLHKRFWRLWSYALPLGFLATYMGWVVREVGRQPWIIYGVMRTEDAVSPVSTGAAATSLALFTLLYCSFLGLFIFFTRRIVKQGVDMSDIPGQAVKRNDMSQDGK